MKSLAEFLGIEPSVEPPQAEVIEDVEHFARQIVTSAEYRASLYRRITLDELPAAVECKLLEYAFGKPTERIVHSGEVQLTKVIREIIDVVDSDAGDTKVVH